MTEDEKNIIFNFAAGKRDLREKAVDIYRNQLTNGNVRGDPYVNFMSEIDTDYPDFFLRAHYRKALLDQLPKEKKHGRKN